jgi:uncharacterized membrane protein YvbJ
MNKKENWLNDVENSLNGIKSAEVNPYLYSKILNRLQTKTQQNISPKFVFASSIALIVLIILNVFIFKSANSSSNTNDLKKLSTTFNLVNENNLNYN